MSHDPTTVLYEVVVVNAGAESMASVVEGNDAVVGPQLVLKQELRERDEATNSDTDGYERPRQSGVSAAVQEDEDEFGFVTATVDAEALLRRTAARREQRLGTGEHGLTSSEVRMSSRLSKKFSQDKEQQEPPGPSLRAPGASADINDAGHEQDVGRLHCVQ